MPGNSDRKGAIRTRRGGNPVAGSGGRRKKGLEGRGPTPKAEDRPNHKAFRRAQRAKVGASGERTTPSRRRDETGPDVVAGRNSVLEALRAGVPVSTLFVAERIDRDDRVREVLTLAAEANIPMLEGPRSELDRLAHGASHQGLLIQVPPYDYADPNDLLDVAAKAGTPPLLRSARRGHRSAQPRRDRAIGRSVRGARCGDPAASCCADVRLRPEGRRRCWCTGAGGPSSQPRSPAR